MSIKTMTLQSILASNEDVVIFDFDYPFYSETYKPIFEQHFIEHFLFDEIGQETVERFKQRLKVKFNEIMPYWNKIFEADNLDQRILDNYSVTENYTRNVTNDSTNKNLASDTPVTKTDFEELDYFSSVVKDIGNGTSKEDWTRTMVGNIGIQTDADAVVHYWQSLRKIEEEIFKECDILFLEVWE